jgi:SH3-like domain-containing protein
MRILVFTLIILFSLSTSAKDAQEMPYYASIKADKANVRTGPSVRYPIQWIYERQNWPVEVTATFENWRKIRDNMGEAGWIHEGLLSGRRHVVITSNGVQEIYRLPILTSAVILISENGVVAELLSCKSGWCKIKLSGEKGWIESKHLWGLNAAEAAENNSSTPPTTSPKPQ